MTLSLTHAFVSGIADDATAAAAGEVLPSHWNAAHALSGGTSGSVLFVNGSGNLAQDNTNLFFDDTNMALFVGGTTSGSYYTYNTFTDSTHFERAVLGWNTVANTFVLGTQKGSAGGTARDLWLQPATNIVRQVNSTNAQAFRIFNTTDGSGNDEWSAIDWRTTPNILTIGTLNTGTGVPRKMQLVAGDGVATSGLLYLGLVYNASGNNWFIGGAGNATVSGDSNMGMGGLALASISSGYRNVGIGVQALNALTSGQFNIGVGSAALAAATADTNNTVIGAFAAHVLNNASATGGNVVIGTQAMYNMTTGTGNTIVGQFPWWTPTSGTNNTIIGSLAGFSFTGGSNNTLIGCWLGTATAINGVIAFSDGSGNVWLDYNYTTSGVWTFAAKIAVPGGSTPVLTTTSAITSGAGAGAGTLTNAPVAGNPTKWIPINDNGTTRYIPAW